MDAQRPTPNVEHRTPNVEHRRTIYSGAAPGKALALSPFHRPKAGNENTDQLFSFLQRRTQEWDVRQQLGALK